MHRKLAEKNAAQGGPRDPVEVARITVDAALDGKLYVLPQFDAKAGWLVKRWFPRWFAQLSRTARNREWLERSASR